MSVDCPSGESGRLLKCAVSLYVYLPLVVVAGVTTDHLCQWEVDVNIDADVVQRLVDDEPFEM